MSIASALRGGLGVCVRAPRGLRALSGSSGSSGGGGLCFELSPDQVHARAARGAWRDGVYIASRAGVCAQKSFQELARTFAKNEIIPKAAHHDQTMEYPKEIFEKAWSLGLVNSHVPKEYALAVRVCISCMGVHSTYANA